MRASVAPTTHPTFQTTTSRSFYGQTIATDLHWSQIDEESSKAKRRAEVSVQKVIEDTQLIATGKKGIAAGASSRHMSRLSRFISEDNLRMQRPFQKKQIDDPPSAVLLARCREFENHPPSEWSGVYAFASK